jgi:hypothetical protein
MFGRLFEQPNGAKVLVFSDQIGTKKDQMDLSC